MIGWVVLGLGLGIPAAVELLSELTAWVGIRSRGIPALAGRPAVKGTAEWPPMLVRIVGLAIAAAVAWTVLGVTNRALVGALGGWGLSYVVQETQLALEAHRDLQRVSVHAMVAQRNR